VLTVLAWLWVCVLGAGPLLWGTDRLSVADAVFESTSGLTTTGSTVLVGLDALSPSLLLWRSMLQWIGGIGIIVMGVAILPFLRVGGMQIFRLESSDRSDKIVPRANEFAVLLIVVYLGLSFACALAYLVAGMSPFEAVNHAMTTVSTGGFSTSDSSMAHFASPTIHWLCTGFMLAGGLPFVLYIQALRGRSWALWQDAQVRALTLFLAATSLGLSVWVAAHEGLPWPEALRLSAFNVTSIVTTTGYALTDYTLWGGAAATLFYFLTFVGGCSGSTAGGFKIYRFQIYLSLFGVMTRRMITPHGVFWPRYEERHVDTETFLSMATFTALFVITIVLLAFALSLTGLDLVTSFSGAATAVTNVGPGLGPLIGPAGSFASLSDTAKWLLSLGMILGRLEIVTVAILVLPAFWRA
jgi:trk system potassium uptake protein TrkH